MVATGKGRSHGVDRRLRTQHGCRAFALHGVFACPNVADRISVAVLIFGAEAVRGEVFGQPRGLMGSDAIDLSLRALGASEKLLPDGVRCQKLFPRSQDRSKPPGADPGIQQSGAGHRP